MNDFINSTPLGCSSKGSVNKTSPDIDLGEFQDFDDEVIDFDITMSSDAQDIIPKSFLDGNIHKEKRYGYYTIKILEEYFEPRRKNPVDYQPGLGNFCKVERKFQAIEACRARIRNLRKSFTRHKKGILSGLDWLNIFLYSPKTSHLFPDALEYLEHSEEQRAKNKISESDDSLEDEDTSFHHQNESAKDDKVTPITDHSFRYILEMDVYRLAKIHLDYIGAGKEDREFKTRGELLKNLLATKSTKVTTFKSKHKDGKQTGKKNEEVKYLSVLNHVVFNQLYFWHLREGKTLERFIVRDLEMAILFFSHIYVTSEIAIDFTREVFSDLYTKNFKLFREAFRSGNKREANYRLLVADNSMLILGCILGNATINGHRIFLKNFSEFNFKNTNEYPFSVYRELVEELWKNEKYQKCQRFTDSQKAIFDSTEEQCYQKREDSIKYFLKGPQFY